MDVYNDALEHYGVKGMKWGVRKDRTNSPRHTGKDRPSSKKSEAQKAYEERKRAYEKSSFN